MLNEPAAMKPEEEINMLETQTHQLVSEAATNQAAPNASSLRSIVAHCIYNSIQPGSGLSPSQVELSHRERLVWLQRQRCVGIWVACDECKKYRYLPHVHDPLQLPERWYCRMNPDAQYAQCTTPEAELSVAEEEDMVHGPYAAGSLVWARMTGYPRWPALVCDDPDTFQYYWLNGFSDIPTYYNVTFLEAEGQPTQRAWISVRNLHKYERTTRSPSTGRYRERLAAAQQQANRALDMPVQERLETFSFVARYQGNINPPKESCNSEVRQHGE